MGFTRESFCSLDAANEDRNMRITLRLYDLDEGFNATIGWISIPKNLLDQVAVLLPTLGAISYEEIPVYECYTVSEVENWIIGESPYEVEQNSL